MAFFRSSHLSSPEDNWLRFPVFFAGKTQSAVLKGHQEEAAGLVAFCLPALSSVLGTSLGRAYFQIPSKSTRNSRQGLFCPLTPWGHCLPPITTPHLHPTTAPGHPETSKHAGCIFALACLPGCWGRRLLKSKLSEGSRRVGGRTVHSQLVDGVLRDDRVGGEVGDHVGATEAAGAGGRRLPFAGQNAQGHGAGSRRTGPHPDPGPARGRGDRVGLR